MRKIRTNKLIWYCIIFFILIIFFISKYIFIFNSFFWAEEPGFLCRAKLILSGYKLYSDLLTGKPPIIHIFLAGIVYLYYNYNILNIIKLIYFVRFLFLVFYIFTVFIICLIIKHLTNDIRILVLCITLLLFDPLLFYQSGRILIEHICNLLIILSLYLLILFEKKKDTKLVILSLMLINITVVSKQYYLILPLFILLYLFKKGYFRFLEILKLYIISLTIFIFIFPLILKFCDLNKFLISYFNGGAIISSYSIPRIREPINVIKRGVLLMNHEINYEGYFGLFVSIIYIIYSIVLFLFYFIYFIKKILEKNIFSNIFSNLLLYCYTYLIILYLLLGGLNTQYLLFFKEIVIITSLLEFKSFLNKVKSNFSIIIYLFLFVTPYILTLLYINKITKDPSIQTLETLLEFLDSDPTLNVYSFKTDICGCSDYYLTKYNYIYIKSPVIPQGYMFQKLFLDEIKRYNISIIVYEKKLHEKLLYNVNCYIYINLSQNENYSIIFFSNKKYKIYIFSKNCSNIVNLPKNSICKNIKNKYIVLKKNIKIYPKNNYKRCAFCLDCIINNCSIKIIEIRINCGYLNYTIRDKIISINKHPMGYPYCLNLNDNILINEFLKKYGFKKIYTISSKSIKYEVYQKIN